MFQVTTWIAGHRTHSIAIGAIILMGAGLGVYAAWPAPEQTQTTAQPDQDDDRWARRMREPTEEERKRASEIFELPVKERIRVLEDDRDLWRGYMLETVDRYAAADENEKETIVDDFVHMMETQRERWRSERENNDGEELTEKEREERREKFFAENKARIKNRISERMLNSDPVRAAKMMSFWRAVGRKTGRGMFSRGPGGRRR